MIGEAYAKAQVIRMAQLDFYPSGPPLRELIRALQSAKSDTIAEAAIDSFMGGETTCPKPAEIRRALLGLSTEQEWVAEPDTPAQCPRCKGTGWVHEVRVIQGQHNDYAGRCLCGKEVR